MVRISLFFLLLAVQAFPAALPFQPAHLEFSNSLNRVVATANPSALYIYDPASGTAQQVSLSRAPLGLSVSPDGRYAAVGHDGLITYVNLATAQVVRTFTVPDVASNVVLAANWIYTLARLNSASGLSYSIQIATGDVTTSEVGRVAAGARLHPDNITIYAGRGADWVPLDISLGPVRTNLQAFSGACTALSYSPDGRRLYSSCTKVSQFSFGTSGPLDLLGRFPDETTVKVAESAALQLAARVSGQSSNQVRLYHTASLQERGRIVLVEDRVVSGVFFSPSGTTLHVASMTAADAFFLDSFDLSTPTSCATPGSTSTTLPGAGGFVSVTVTAPTGCVFRATTDTPWIQLISGVTGNSNSTLQFHAGPNPGGNPRTGTLRIGTQTITVTQQGSQLPDLQVPQPISFPVSGADYSKTLNRLVLVSAQVRELRVLDPLSNASLTVPLERTPLSVAVSPDGLRAVVGQPGRVSVVNLQTGAIERNTATPDYGDEVAYAGNNYVYSTPHQDLTLQTSQLYSTLPDQGTTVTLQIPGGQRGLRLHPNNGRLYVGSPNRGRYSRFDVRSGVAAAVDPTKSVANCGNLWFSEDGAQLFTACGTVHQASADFDQDGIPLLGPLSAPGSPLQWVADSSAQRLTAVIPTNQANTVQFYNSSRALATQRALGTVGGQPTNGRYAFWNASGTRLIVVSQAASDWLVETIDVAALASCAITVSPTTITIDSNGGSGAVNVNTFGPCSWQASSTAPWITLVTTSGSGPGVVSFVAEPNRGGARSGTIAVAGVTATVQQAAGSNLTLIGSLFRFASQGGISTIRVEAPASAQAWTAVSTVPWITITSGQSGTGNGSVTFQVAAYSGSLTRSGAVRIGGVEYIIYQSGLDPGLRFVPITPCRVVDTRGEPGLTTAFGTPAISGGTERAFPIVQGRCNIPANVRAYALNVTVVPTAALSFLSIYPTGAARPVVSTLNSFNGVTKANAAIVPAGADGGVSVFVTDTTEVILDVNGYFVPATATNIQTTLAYQPVGACRLLDTRLTTSLAAGETRTLPLRTTLNACSSIGPSARAYNLNVTVIPKNGRVSFLTLWPSGAARPVVSTLNSPRGTIVANAAIITAGPDGAIQVFSTDPADVLIDLAGTFLPESGEGLYHLYPVTPCRIADTRNGPGAFGGPTLTPGEVRSFPLAAGGCGVPADPNIPRVYVLGATVVPQGPLSYLTLYSTSAQRPFVSTLNAFEGAVTSNLALVQGGMGSAVSAFVTDRTDLVLDVSGFFATP